MHFKTSLKEVEDNMIIKNSIRFLVLAIMNYSILFFSANAEFVSTANKQIKDGYEWDYIGKTKPSGVPAITVKPQVGDEYILFKLKK